MLTITSDGKKIGLDERLIDPEYPDEPDSKINRCVENVYKIYTDGNDKKLTQLIFCDMSTPSKEFNVYDDIKAKLAARGIPENEIEYIHNANTDNKKAALFKAVREGDVRILIGSTSKMGAGTNVQERLVALHHLDCPWKPSDIEQRNGRIIRQGNTNKNVYIYNYVTKNTFDAYLYQTLENKQRFISQIMTSKSPARTCEDCDEAVLNYAEIKSLCTGDPRIREKMDLDISVARLRELKSDYLRTRHKLEDAVNITYPKQIAEKNSAIENISKDLLTAQNNPLPEEDYEIIIDGVKITDKEKAGEMFSEVLHTCKAQERIIGKYRGFDVVGGHDFFRSVFYAKLKGVEEPEAKRKIIGEEFIRVFEEEAKKIGAVDYLVQGTIYPDVIESGLGKSATIKSHHNVGGLPDYVDFKEIIEPLRMLFKDEVRKAGLELGIPEYLVYRQPFPGPGLGIRIIGEVTADKVRIVQDADYIYREEIAKAGVEGLGQYFAALTNMRSVGVMGDERTYDYAVALRAVCTADFMTADCAQIPWDVLSTVANRIVNEVKGVNRVLYDCTSKPPATIEFE